MPENTMVAFEHSLNKADYIELDVSFSKDGVAVIIHDDTLIRTSDVKNHSEFEAPYNVVDYTYKELLKLDFSSWFTKDDPFDSIKNNLISKEYLAKLPIQRIVTLEEILEFVKKNNFPVNIEIKDMKKTPFDKVAVKKIVEIVEKRQVENLVLFSSFNHNYMKQLSKLAPNITRAALQEKKHPKNIIQYLKKLNVQGYHCDRELINENIVKQLNENGFFVNAYTVNDPKEKDKLFSFGLKAIFTDFL